MNNNKSWCDYLRAGWQTPQRAKSKKQATTNSLAERR